MNGLPFKRLFKQSSMTIEAFVKRLGVGVEKIGERLVKTCTCQVSKTWQVWLIYHLHQQMKMIGH